MNKVYIIEYNSVSHHTIESVWSTRELAESAILYLASRDMKSRNYYSIYEREIDEAVINE